MSDVDFGRHSADYSAYRPGFPASFYRRLDAMLRIDGSRTLDLATGPGTIALELAQLGSSVLGVDLAAQQVVAATRASLKRGLDARARFAVARAEHTGLEASSFDLVTAGHCWHWFDSRAVLAETLRVLRPDGALVIAYYSYLAMHSPVARASEDLVLRFNPAWSMAGADGMYPELVDELLHAGFRHVEQFCYHHDQEFTHERWRGRMRTCNGVGSGGLPPTEVQRFDHELGQLLARDYSDPMLVEHRVWGVVASSPSAT